MLNLKFLWENNWGSSYFSILIHLYPILIHFLIGKIRWGGKPLEEENWKILEGINYCEKNNFKGMESRSHLKYLILLRKGHFLLLLLLVYINFIKQWISLWHSISAYNILCLYSSPVIFSYPPTSHYSFIYLAVLLYVHILHSKFHIWEKTCNIWFYETM